MGYRIEWSSKSLGDLSAHAAFLKRVSAEAAKTTLSAIIAKGDSLAQFPERCAEFPMPGHFPVVIRKCVVDGRYVILFGVCEDAVMIFRVLDARRKFDGLLE